MTRFPKLFAGLLLALATSASAAEPVAFDTAVQPFFQTYCLRCHNGQKQEGEFRLDTLKREFTEVKTKFGKVTVKLGKLDGKTVQAAPEFESCKKLATKAKVPVKFVYDAASKAIRALSGIASP